jgi:hypothetical protein
MASIRTFCAEMLLAERSNSHEVGIELGRHLAWQGPSVGHVYFEIAEIGRVRTGQAQLLHHLQPFVVLHFMRRLGMSSVCVIF